MLWLEYASLLAHGMLEHLNIASSRYSKPQQVNILVKLSIINTREIDTRLFLRVVFILLDECVHSRLRVDLDRRNAFI